MQKVVIIGEAVYDIMFKDHKPIHSKVGGSMLNVSVSVARTGVPVEFSGTLANDKIGTEMLKFLDENNVGKSYIKFIDDAKSNVALAFLSNKAVPEYLFYRDDKLNGHHLQIRYKEISILVVGSFFSIREENFKEISRIVQTAISNKTMVVYDPNVRDKDLYKDQDLVNRIRYFFRNANIIKASGEDMERITGSNDEVKWFGFLQDCNVDCYIITNGPGDVLVNYFGEHFKLQVPQVDVKSTVGAGDAFTAGIVRYLYMTGTQNVDIQSFLKAVSLGITFASNVCSSYDNYIEKSLINR